MEKCIVQLDNVSIGYPMPQERITSFKESALRWFRGQRNSTSFWALRDISLNVDQGEAVGIVGANGAGKSTLLKVVARVLSPTTGRVRVGGLVAPILGIGAGFDAEMTGRENVYLYGAMLGFSRTDMNRKIDKLLDFAGLGRFIDAPLRTFSDGMIARLAFSVATDVNPDLLLLDEVFSVGDKDFQRKCRDRVVAFNTIGTTIILVSHNLDTVAEMCSRIIWMDHGQIRLMGKPSDVIPLYEDQAAIMLGEREQPDLAYDKP
jgi:ABC-type polysaccharide/polyol phosphate transport system ATPase subunit